MSNSRLPEDYETRPTLRLPDGFIHAFAEDLLGVFGPGVFRKVVGDTHGIYYVCGTGRWTEALQSTCQRLHMMWFFERYIALRWWVSDDLDERLADAVLADAEPPEILEVTR